MLTNHQILSPRQKAYELNSDPSIYGSFAEIGAGQETVRYFFRAGNASKTIAKAMSAYDKRFSDDIYGVEPDHRYVTQHRLRKMLDQEMTLILERLSSDINSDKKYFSFANTVTTGGFNYSIKGHGWVGIKFQHRAGSEFNEIILHVELHETDITHQQETLGRLGVNLVYGAYQILYKKVCKTQEFWIFVFH